MIDPLTPTRLPDTDADDPRRLYADLLKKTLTRYAFGETWTPYSPRPRSARSLTNSTEVPGWPGGPPPYSSR